MEGNLAKRLVVGPGGDDWGGFVVVGRLDLLYG